MEKQTFSDEELHQLILTLKMGNAWDKRVALYQLGMNQDSRALNALVEALDDEDTNIGERAANAIGNLGDPAGFEPLAAHLTENAILPRIMWSLVELDPQRAIKYILPFLQYENIQTQKIAITALVHTQDAKAIRQVGELIHHPELKEHIIRVLNTIKDPKAIPILAAVLQDTSFKIRLSAVWALGRIQNEQCVPYLIPMLNDIYPYTVRITHKALKQIKTPEARAAVQAWRQAHYARKQQYKRHKKE